MDLSRRLPYEGFALTVGGGFSYLWGHIGQHFSEQVTVPGYPSLSTGCINDDRNTQAILMLEARAGLSWSPKDHEQTRVFLGYQFEYWPQIGRDDNTGSRGDLYQHGLFLRGEYDF